MARRLFELYCDDRLSGNSRYFKIFCNKYLTKENGELFFNYLGNRPINKDKLRFIPKTKNWIKDKFRFSENLSKLSYVICSRMIWNNEKELTISNEYIKELLNTILKQSNNDYQYSDCKINDQLSKYSISTKVDKYHRGRTFYLDKLIKYLDPWLVNESTRQIIKDEIMPVAMFSLGFKYDNDDDDDDQMNDEQLDEKWKSLCLETIDENDIEIDDDDDINIYDELNK